MPKNKKTAREQNMKLVEIKRRFGENPDGSPHYKSFYGKTKSIAEHAYQEQLKQLHLEEAVFDNDSSGSSNILLSDWVKKWLSMKFGTVTGITYRNTYEAPTERHILPYFKHQKLSAIKASDLSVFMKTLDSYCYSEQSKTRLCLKEIFESALDDKLITSNPAKKLKISKKAAEKVVDKRAYTFEQSRIVIDFAKTHRFGLDIVLLLKSGLRRSELTILPRRYTSEKHGGIDMDNMLIRVRESISESKYGLEISPCKSSKSQRDIPFDDELFEMLDADPDRNVYVSSGKSYKKKYIVSGKYGENMRPSNWDKRFAVFKKEFEEYSAANNLGIPMLTPHELRHSFGSILYERGVDIVTISKLMGHASIEITVKLYVHDSMELMRDAIQRMAYSD